MSTNLENFIYFQNKKFLLAFALSCIHTEPGKNVLKHYSFLEKQIKCKEFFNKSAKIDSFITINDNYVVLQFRIKCNTNPNYFSDLSNKCFLSIKIENDCFVIVRKYKDMHTMLKEYNILQSILYGEFCNVK